MKLSGIREQYYFYSGKTSDVSRQLSFAGIAIIWLFRSIDNSSPVVPVKLIFPMLFFVVSLLSDILQYVTGTLIWGVCHYFREIECQKLKLQGLTDKDPDLPAWSWFNRITLVFFTTKVVSVILAYWWLGKYLFGILPLREAIKTIAP